MDKLDLGRLAVCASIARAACGGRMADDPGDGGTSGPDGAAPPTTVDAQPPPVDEAGVQCNTVALLGGPVDFQQVATAPPPLATGGTLVAATYVLTSYVVYTGPGGASGSLGPGQITADLEMAKKGPYTWSTASLISNGAPKYENFNAVPTAPGELSFQPVCPASLPDLPPTSYFTESMYNGGIVLHLRTQNGSSAALDEVFTTMTK